MAGLSSKRRLLAPSIVGTRCRRSSSIRLAARYWRALSATPLTRTSSDPAVFRALSRPTSIPSATKTYDVPPSLTMVSAGRCDHKDRGVERRLLTHGPMPRSAIRRPMISAPMLLKLLGLEGLGLGSRPALEHPCVQQLAATTHRHIRRDRRGDEPSSDMLISSRPFSMTSSRRGLPFGV